MLIKFHIITAAIAVSSLFMSLDAKINDHTEHEIRHDLQSRRYDQLGIFLKEYVGSSKSHLAKLKKIAKQEKSRSLCRAVDAATRFKKIRKGLGMSVGAFLQTALYIESDMRKQVQHKQYYLPKHKTGLSKNLEYDPRSKTTFIICGKRKANYLGRGAKKTVYRSVEYKNGKTAIVARAEQACAMNRELKITKKLRGAPGIISVKGFGKHKQAGKKYKTTYSKLYTTGTLKTILQEKIKLSLYEKIKICYNILQGLESMHSRGIVHRDLAAQNFFVTIPHGKAGKRNVKAVIADFGWAAYAKTLAHKKPQANYKSTAPEGFLLKRMKHSAYYATDIFSTGRVFYRLLYGEKKGKWLQGFSSGSPKWRYFKYFRIIQKHTHARRKVLEHKQARSHVSNKERFEYLILKMIHPNASMRGSAKTLRKQMKSLLNKF